MQRQMLINALHPEECRIAITEDSNLVELEVESNLGKKLKGNIYKARIARIEPSLQAAFIDLGTERNGFLQINDVHPAYFRRVQGRSGGRPRIQDVLYADQELIVQVVKEEREMKGATLTTYLSLPGRYLVVMPGSERGGISRKINDNEQRHRLKKLAHELEIPAGMGIIIRTAGLDRSLSELSRDLSLQLKLWERILSDAQSAPCPTVLYKESELATRVIRDYFTPEIREIVIDDPATYQNVKTFVGEVMPRYRSRVRLFEQKQPIFSYYNVEEQVLETFKQEVKLRSGGSIVIDALEALVAIDVNSGKATGEVNIEETAFKTNLEAADEIARQLRLRDLGGLIVVDFIDMIDRRHKAAVERQMRDAVRSDKARIEVGRLSKFGLLEMSRQRLRASLTSQSHLKCAHCQGIGKLKNPELVALEALRKIQSAVIVGQANVVKARLAPAAALFLLNNKKQDLAGLEKDHSARIFVLADGRMRPDEYEFEIESRRLHAAASAAQIAALKPIEDNIEDGDGLDSDADLSRPPTTLTAELEEEDERLSAMSTRHSGEDDDLDDEGLDESDDEITEIEQA
ncbi:MAG: Rne/Rng family ribonuclease [Deltaproteobacteria bacterium]|nr:Rne/Rng family ribonuclease [Deltaproteobacteria bacterium]